MDPTWLSWDQNHTVFLLVDSTCLHSSMARTKVMLKKSEKGRTKVMWTRIVVHAKKWVQGPSSPMHPISGTRNPFRSRWNHEMYSGGREAGGGGEVATVITYLTVGPDGCGGLAIYVGWGGASQEEALADCVRQSSLKGILEGQQGQENLEVPIGNSCPSWDLPVPKEHRAPHSETPLLAVIPWDSPWSGQVWSALPGACYNMLAGSYRSIYSRSHGRHQPLHHTCKTGDNYAQRFSASPVHPWRASVLLKSSPKSVLVCQLVVGCVGFLSVQGKGI